MALPTLQGALKDGSGEGPCEQFWHGQGCPLFDVVYPAFPLPTMALPTLQSAPKDVLERLMECDMPEPRKCPSLDSCQRRFLWTHKEIDLTPHSVVGFVLQDEDEKFPQTLISESLDLFFSFFLFRFSE